MSWLFSSNTPDLPIMAHWMSKFALEVQKLNCDEYQPNGIMRHIKLVRSVELDFLSFLTSEQA